VKSVRKLVGAIVRFAMRELVQLAEEAEILPGGEARIEALVASRVEAQLAANRAWVFGSVVAGDDGLSTGGQQESGEDAKECGLAGAVGAEQSDGFPLFDFERNATDGGASGAFERLQERANAGARRRVILFDGFEDNGGGRRGWRHRVFYNVSGAAKQPAIHRDLTEWTVVNRRAKKLQ
jgi:hypothetical protein